ncbi:MAG: response regulator [Planctomycetales bacterium]|nr:response regulator [Planctomycetales bacterium]
MNATTTDKFEPTTSPISADVVNRKIMIVDDEPVNIKVVQKYLASNGYSRFVTTTDSLTAVELMRSESPDVLLLDVMMPGIDGFYILEKMRSDPKLKFIPVLILTAVADPETKERALRLGATDFLSKPVDPADLRPRVRNALIAKAHQDELEHYAERLEHQVRVRTAELEASRRDVICCLAGAGEYRDQETGNHVIRVGLFSGIIGRQLGLDDETASILEQAALLHDVGKIGVSDLILLKPGKLTDEEFAIMKRHCEFGKNIIASSDIRWRKVGRQKLDEEKITIGKSPIMEMAARIAYSHHERWDGTGYPEGLRSEDIPLEGRIVAITDVFDALSSVRPYKEAIPPQRCFEMIREGRGSHFDPAVTDAFFASKEEILQVQREYVDRLSETDFKAMNTDTSPTKKTTQTPAPTAQQKAVQENAANQEPVERAPAPATKPAPIEKNSLKQAFLASRRPR